MLLMDFLLFARMLAKYSPIDFSKVKLLDTFWAPRQDQLFTKSLPITYLRLKETGRIDALKLQWSSGKPNKPHIFWDSDVAKWVESAAFALRLKQDSTLERMMNEIADLIVKSQQPDGYINSYYTTVEPDKRFTNLRDNHELYCAGHLMEAAVEHFKTTQQKNLLDALCRYADFIDTQFGGEDGKRKGYCGHEEIELALIKLYQTTNNPKYLKLAKYFIDERGQMPYYFEKEARLRGEPETKDFNTVLKRMMYYQAHCPPREQEEMVGHAVRMNYLCAGMADVARETDDLELFEACDKLWTDGTMKKMYITGGIGNSAQNEGFTTAYDLPNDTAYAETCAAIALVFFSHRMLQFACNSKYADVIERALYNGIISGISLDGGKFLYENPLAADPQRRKFERNDWFGCSCCPNNLTRLVASLGQYIYSQYEDQLALHLFIANRTSVTIKGTVVSVQQETNYPWDGMVKLTFNPEKPIRFSLKIRVPSWCTKYSIKVNGKVIQPTIDSGYLVISQEWKKDDIIEYEMDMPIERMHAHPRIAFNTGCIALQRGPLVYCLEQVDNGSDLNQILLPKSAKLHALFDANVLNGVVCITGEAQKTSEKVWDKAVYSPVNSEFTKISIKSVPYYAWNNRGLGEMLVWIREI